MTDAPATNELLAERAKLIAANEAATGWGAAVGARLERIIEIDRQLRAAATLSAQGAEASVEATARLADAMWQLLDDMGASGQSVCLASKAEARIAYEPFRDKSEDFKNWMSLEAAQRLLKESEQ